MKSRISKIKAFTLNEMLVVLLITSIVIGMGFAVLRLVQQQMHGISSIFDENTEVNLLRQSLWVDFNQYDGIWYDSKKDELVLANEIKQTRYQWHETYIVKEQDTFFLKTQLRQHYFNGWPIPAGEVDGLDFLVGTERSGQRIMVYKTNAATTYINQ